MNFSKKAVWLASNSEHGARLVEIAQEHTKLALQASKQIRAHEDTTDTLQRIEALRQERNQIITFYEEGGNGTWRKNP